LGEMNDIPEIGLPVHLACIKEQGHASIPAGVHEGCTS
jgi:hypothetical protein